MAEADATEGSLVAPAEGDNNQPAQEQNPPQAEGKAQPQESWANSLPDELKPKMQRFKTVQDLAKSYVELERFSGKAVQDMTPEEQQRFFKRVGRPDKPDEYELSPVALPQGVKRDPKGDDPYRQIAFELGLTKAQAKGIHEWATKGSLEAVAEARRIIAKRREEAVDTLRKDWGTDFDANVKAVQSLVANVGGKDVAQLLNSKLEDGSVLGDNPVMLRFLKRIKGSMTEDTLVAGTVPGSAPAVEPGGFDWSRVPSVSGENRYARR